MQTTMLHQPRLAVRVRKFSPIIFPDILSIACFLQPKTSTQKRQWPEIKGGLSEKIYNLDLHYGL